MGGRGGTGRLGGGRGVFKLSPERQQTLHLSVVRPGRGLARGAGVLRAAWPEAQSPWPEVPRAADPATGMGAGIGVRMRWAPLLQTTKETLLRPLLFGEPRKPFLFRLI